MRSIVKKEKQKKGTTVKFTKYEMAENFLELLRKKRSQKKEI